MRILVALLTLMLISSATQAGDSTPRVERVLSQEEQAALTPEQVLALLKQGNKRFVSGTITSRDHSALVRSAADGQFPKAVILSCLDSRIPVEDVFDRGIGDIFVARVAGNFENTDILGSMEFATLRSITDKSVFKTEHPPDYGYAGVMGYPARAQEYHHVQN